MTIYIYIYMYIYIYIYIYMSCIYIAWDVTTNINCIDNHIYTQIVHNCNDI